MDNDGDAADAADKDPGMNNPAKLRAALKKSMDRCKLYRAELDKSLENATTLEQAVRERDEHIQKLTAENRQLIESRDRAAALLEQQSQDLIEKTHCIDLLSIELETHKRSDPDFDLASENTRLKQSIEQIEAELAVFKSQPDSDTISRFYEDRCAHLADISAREQSLKSDQASIEELRRSLNQSKSILRRDQAKFEQESFQLRQERQRLEDLKREQSQTLAKGQSDASLLARERSEFERQKAEFEKEVRSLEELRDSEFAERQKLEIAQAQFADLEARTAEYRQKYAEFCEQRSEFARAQSGFAREKEEARVILAQKQEIESQGREIQKQLRTMRRDREAFAALEEEITERKREIAAEDERIGAARAKMEKERDEVQKLLRGFEGQRDQFERDFRQVRANIATFEAEKAKLRPELEMVGRIESLEEKLGVQEKVIGELKKKLQRGRQGPNGAVQLPYLKKVLLQFFIQESSARASLIPVMLKLVSCSDAEVQVALRKWNESLQLVSRSFWIF
jgi:chromosome segregation ATPase